MAETAPVGGTLAYQNWHEILRGSQAHEVLEYPLFSDASLIGESVGEYGPYDLINTAAGSDQNGFPSAILRAAYVIDEDMPSWADTTNEEGYHGGFVADEIAALLSLAVGARIRAGEANRWFRNGGDPKGRPIAPAGEEIPPPFIRPGRRLVLPKLATEKHIGGLVLIAGFSRLAPQQSVALVRAARLYQDAVWIGETQTGLGWLMMVSAVETAANHWQNVDDQPKEKLAAWRSELATRLEAAGGVALLEYAADQIAPVIGSTSKFCRFLLEFAPSPPTRRPPDYAQIAWTRTKLRQMYSKIYDYRSRALHVGTPFPAPMNWKPHLIGEEGAYSERVSGTASGIGPFMWDEADTPMLFQTFEFIARQALTNWWTQMLAE